MRKTAREKKKKRERKTAPERKRERERNSFLIEGIRKERGIHHIVSSRFFFFFFSRLFLLFEVQYDVSLCVLFCLSPRLLRNVVIVL